jgi:hypothetical protein
MNDEDPDAYYSRADESNNTFSDLGAIGHNII